MNTGTLSGTDVLQFGQVERGATVRLRDGRSGEVLDVRGRRLTLRGIAPGSALIQFHGDQAWLPSAEIAAVIAEPTPDEAAGAPERISAKTNTATL